MASFEANEVISLPAGEDLTGDLHKLLQVANDGEVVLATAATQVPIGTCGEEVDAAGKVTSVVLLKGIVKMIAADNSIAPGELVVPTTGGKVVGIANHATMAADTVAVGIALDTSATDGDVIRVVAGLLAASTD